MPPTNPNINTQVLPNIPKGVFPDHVFHDHPTLMKFIEKGEKQNGGLDYAPNRIFGKDAASVRFSGTTLAPVIVGANQTSKLLNETYNWTNLITPMTLTYDEELRAGDSEFTKISMLEAKKKQAKLTHLDDLATDLMTGSGIGSVPFGLSKLIDPTAVFGGVDPANDPDWVSKTITAASILSGQSALQNAFQATLFNGHRPTLFPTTEVLFSRCANMFSEQIHYVDKGKLAERGLDTLKFKGGEIYMDRDMPDNNLWMLTEDVIHYKQSSTRFMKVKPPDVPTAGTDVHLSLVGWILSSYIIGADERRVHGGFTSLTF